MTVSSLEKGLAIALIGSGSAGKTSIIRALSYMHPYVEEGVDLTLGRTIYEIAKEHFQKWGVSEKEWAFLNEAVLMTENRIPLVNVILDEKDSDRNANYRLDCSPEVKKTAQKIASLLRSHLHEYLDQFDKSIDDLVLDAASKHVSFKKRVVFDLIQQEPSHPFMREVKTVFV